MSTINGRTRLCGLIGNPVEHSISPTIHNTLAAFMNINLAYATFLVEQGKLSTAVRGARALNILGMNVTVPYKSDVIAELVDIDPLAEKIGAVNTLVRKGKGFKGYNTDMPGLNRAMMADGVDIKGRSVIVLGAGGAARAVCFMLSQYGAKEIILINRTIERADRIANEIREREPGFAIRTIALNDYQSLEGENYICIQATSVGMSPKNNDVLIADSSFYEKVEVGYDLIYTPYETRFMKLVRQNNGRAYNGLKMLLYQGVFAFELWNRVDVPDEICKKVFTVMKEEMGIHE